MLKFTIEKYSMTGGSRNIGILKEPTSKYPKSISEVGKEFVKFGSKKANCRNMKSF